MRVQRFLSIIPFLLISALSSPAQQQTVPVEERALAKTVSDSVVLLYKQDESGGMSMLCTATGYSATAPVKQGQKITYRFVSAAHCVEGDEDDEQKDIKFFITRDDIEKVFSPAKLIQAGDKNHGDDFAIFEVTTDLKFETTPLGDDTKTVIGDSVLDVSAPDGLGKLYYFGYISAVRIERPKLEAQGVNWENPMIISIGGGPGSSGSAIVSLDQKAIIGFLVGSFNHGDPGFITIPVSQFKKFVAAVDAGKYKKKNSIEDVIKHLSN